MGNSVKIGKSVKFVLSTAKDNEATQDNLFDECINREIIVENNVTIGYNIVRKAGSIISQDKMV